MFECFGTTKRSFDSVTQNHCRAIEYEIENASITDTVITSQFTETSCGNGDIIILEAGACFSLHSISGRETNFCSASDLYTHACVGLGSDLTRILVWRTANGTSHTMCRSLARSLVHAAFMNLVICCLGGVGGFLLFHDERDPRMSLHLCVATIDDCEYGGSTCFVTCTWGSSGSSASEVSLCVGLCGGGEVVSQSIRIRSLKEQCGLWRRVGLHSNTRLAPTFGCEPGDVWVHSIPKRRRLSWVSPGTAKVPTPLTVIHQHCCTVEG